MAKAAAVQYCAGAADRARASAGAHRQSSSSACLKEVEQAPGIVLYTIVKKELIEEIERRCRELKVPAPACARSRS